MISDDRIDETRQPMLPQTVIMMPTKTTPLVYIPVATRSVVGGVKVGSGLIVEQDGTLKFDRDALPFKTLSVNGKEVEPDIQGNLDLKVYRRMDIQLTGDLKLFDPDKQDYMTFSDFLGYVENPLIDVCIWETRGGTRYLWKFSHIQSGTNFAYFTNSGIDYVDEMFVINAGSFCEAIKQTSKLETTANKISTITSSSSDKQYPSAKAVKTYVDDKVRAMDISKTSELENDGDGTSPFATNAQIDPIITAVDDIESMIPAQASKTNVLADRQFVNDTIQTNSANFRGNWNTWSDVPENIDDYPADYTGKTKPTVNDYLVVDSPEDYHRDEIFTKTGATNGYSINANGEFVQTTSFSYTDKLSVDTKDSVASFTGKSSSGNTFRVHAYGNNDEWLGQVSYGTVGASGTITIIGNLPDDTKYLRVSYPTNATNMSLATYEISGVWRFKYTGDWDVLHKSGWIPEYQVNDTPFTSDQWGAINSGITSDAVNQITTNTTNIETLTEGQTEFDNRLTDIENDLDHFIEGTLVTEITESSKDDEVPSAKAVYSVLPSIEGEW